MESCDVLIVGGGPAGSSCARRLAEAGLSVLLLDKSRFPRDKVCAGWITPEVIRLLQLDLADYAAERVLQPIFALCTGMIGESALQTHYSEPVSYGIRRREFDDYLLQRSRARLQLGMPVKDIRRSGQGWLINEQIQAKMLVGAGGHFCPVARQLNANVTEKTVVSAKELEFCMSGEQAAGCAVSGEMPEIYFCRDMLGYGWCFRKGDFLNIGLGRRNNQHLSAHVDDFVSWLKSSGRICFALPAPLKGHAYYTYDQQARQRLDEGVLLVGDAAGMAFPESGEGILPAVKSGLLAADTIIACGGDYAGQRLAAYEAALTENFGDAGAFDPLGLLPLSVRLFLGRKMLASAALTRRVVVEKWFLHRST